MSKNILLIGAGKSATSLIDYLLNHSSTENWKVTIADMNVKLAEEKIGGRANGTAIMLDVANQEQLEKLVTEHDLVISMLPPFMHMQVAHLCIKYKKHLATASYVSDEMQALDADA